MSLSRLTLSAVLLASSVGFAAVPALAQSSQGNGSTSSTTAQSSSSGNDAAGKNAPAGSLVKTNGDWRSSELVGATVYNDNGNSVGTINDLLVSSDGTISNAILSVGGFLGIGTKLVEVPFNKLKFVPSDTNPASKTDAATAPAQDASNAGSSAANTSASGSTTGAAAPADGNGSAPSANADSSAQRHPDFSVTLPGATKDSLKSDPEFHFAD